MSYVVSYIVNDFKAAEGDKNAAKPKGKGKDRPMVPMKALMPR